MDNFFLNIAPLLSIKLKNEKNGVLLLFPFPFYTNVSLSVCMNKERADERSKFFLNFSRLFFYVLS